MATGVTGARVAGIGIMLGVLVGCSTAAESASPPLASASANVVPSAQPSTVASPSVEPCELTGASPAPSAIEGPVSAAWEIGAIEPPTSGSEFGGLEWFDGVGWLAFGLQADGHAGIWISSTGESWVSATSPAPPVGGGYRVVDVALGIVGGCPRLVAVVQRATSEAGQGWSYGTGSVALYSDDGLSWSLAATQPSTSAWLSGVAATSVGFVSIGTETSWPSAAQTRVDGRMWTSPDAEVWTEISPPELVDFVPLGIGTMDGMLIATGFADQVSPPQLAWLSTDGTAWSPHEAFPPASEGSIFEIADSEGGLAVMLGLGPQGTYASTSNDGETWTFEYFPGLNAEPSGIDIRAGNVVAALFQNCGDCVAYGLVQVRDAATAEWRSVDLADHVPASMVGSFLVRVAMNDSRTIFVTNDGTTFLTNGPLP